MDAVDGRNVFNVGIAVDDGSSLVTKTMQQHIKIVACRVGRDIIEVPVVVAGEEAVGEETTTVLDAVLRVTTSPRSWITIIFEES